MPVYICICTNVAASLPGVATVSISTIGDYMSPDDSPRGGEIRIAVATAGFSVIAGGMALIVLTGPGLV